MKSLINYFLAALLVLAPVASQAATFGKGNTGPLNGNNVWTGSNEFDGVFNVDGAADFDSTVDLAGATITMPAAVTFTTVTVTTGNITTLNVSGVSTLDGNTTLGNALTDSTTVTGDLILSSAEVGIACRNETGGGMAAGDLVYVTSWDSTDVVLVDFADANNNLFAEYVVGATIGNNATGVCYKRIEVTGINTSAAAAEGDEVCLTPTATTTNTWAVEASCTALAGEFRQVAGVVTVDAASGAIAFELPGRVEKLGTNELQLESVTVNEMADLARGSILVGSTAGNRPAALDANDTGKILVGDGTDLASVAVSGDVTLSAAGAVQIVADVVGNAELDPYLPKTLCFLYDFTVLGGAQSALAMTKCSDGTAQTIPDNAVIIRVIQESDVDLTSGGAATVALGYTGNDNAFLAATAYTDASFDVDIVSSRAAELPIMTGAAVSVLNTIGAADLTAGKFKLYVTYIEGD